jgi:hypothetical protein
VAQHRSSQFRMKKAAPSSQQSHDTQQQQSSSQSISTHKANNFLSNQQHQDSA